jgi:Trypsin-like peptidase domain
VVIHPSSFVIPVVALNDDGSCGRFLGTGVFVTPAKLLVTCEHVLQQWEGQFAGIIEDRPDQLFPLEVISRNVPCDLALLQLKEYVPDHSLPLANDDDIILNKHVMCFEYGTTITAGNHISFSPANRVGNVTRFRDLTDRFHQAGDHMLELSFPALMGASGSPVMELYPPYALWGIVKENVATELMPAQVERVVDDQGLVEEETKFLLPHALAIHVKHVRRLLSEANT